MEIKREYWELQQMQSMSLSSKISMTLSRIVEWYEYYKGAVYVSWSGGKDSTVLKHLAQSIYPDIKVVYVDTGLEYPELKEFVKKEPNVEILHPKMPFWKVVQKYGYPVISKEVSECVGNARKYLTDKREREREISISKLKYAQHYRKLCGVGEYASKSPKNNGNIEAKEFP